VADVLIVDDHELLATALQLSLRASGFEAEVVPPQPFPVLIRALLERRPHVVLLDLDLGSHGDSTCLIAPLTEAGIRVVVVTGLSDRLRIAAALEAGAIGYRSKAEGMERLIETVRDARTADGPLDAHTRVALFDELRRRRAERAQVLAPFGRLTEREQETLRALASGRSVREIADDWVVSEATVRTHVRSVLGKLGTRSQLGAVAMAIQTGWLDLAAASVA
jgi:DNA-binding NarL/FixJ family response regulator